jgi:putative pyruvate formate lyase activating enzyme
MRAAPEFANSILWPILSLIAKMATTFEPAYRQLVRTGELRHRVEQAYERLSVCDLCAQNCRIDRHVTKGVCRTGIQAIVSSYGPHHGEENPLRGWLGSGTIFFAWCNLKCQFCQNYEISQLGEGREVRPEEIAAMMLELQESGCHNINFVSPSHVVAQILAAVAIAAEAGLRVPLVWNTGGYDSLAALQLLDGVVDIYMPDMKYADARLALKLSKARNYPEVNRAAVKEMHRQVGDLVMDERGIALRGLLVRHLVMPGDIAGTPEIARFLAEEVSRNTYLNVMVQYHPCYKANEHPPLDRRITPKEYAQAVAACRAVGLHRFDH